jgi:hypothetical protein
MNKNISIFALVCVFTGASFSSAFAQGPCQQIKSACLSAGFIPKDVKQGKGLWRDCVAPIIQGQTPNNATLPLPSVDPSVVSACKAKNPKFGEGKVGS